MKVEILAYLDDDTPVCWIIEHKGIYVILRRKPQFYKENRMPLTLPDSSKDAIQHLLECSQHLHGELVRSPLWELVKNEPVILHWMAALTQVEKLVNPQSEEDQKLYGNPPKA